MADCATQTFTSITQDKFDQLLVAAQAQGINIAGNNGSASQDGITISWNFDPGQQILSIQCTSAPFFVSCGAINSKIHDLVDQSG
jgi:hypothetical protein